MQVKLSKANQETAVGEGLALGCVALGVESFNAAKMTIELGAALLEGPHAARGMALLR